MAKWYSNGLTEEIIQKEGLEKRTAVIDSTPALGFHEKKFAFIFRIKYDNARISMCILTDMKDAEQLMNETKSYKSDYLKNKPVEAYVNPKDSLNFLKGISIDSKLYKSHEWDSYGIILD